MPLRRYAVSLNIQPMHSLLSEVIPNSLEIYLLLGGSRESLTVAHTTELAIAGDLATSDHYTQPNLIRSE